VSAERPAREAAAELRGLRRLLELQELDLSTDRLQIRLDTLRSQEEIRTARSRTTEAEARLGEHRLAIDDVATEQRRLEHDLDLLQQKIDAESKRLYDGTVANAKELQSIEAEVRSLGSRRGRLEDLLLERMERREELEGRLPPLEAEIAELRERLAEIEGTSARDLVEIERALADRRGEREALVPEFDDDLLELYEELRRQKKGVGAAALVDGVCQGCHQKLSPMYVDRLKRSEELHRCEYCRRILVFA
jgi:predicted  nucleic acid-binding Zn-ribbon protein